MIFQKKSRFKPLYKQFIRLGENVQNRKKILKFKKQKWYKLISRIKWKQKWYKKFRAYDQNYYTVSRYPNKWDSYKDGRYRNNLKTYNRFKLLYGNFTKKNTKKYIRYVLKNQKRQFFFDFLNLFESRIDVVIYRAKFSLSIRASRQMIVHGNILINGITVTNKCHYLKPGDHIKIKKKYQFIVEKNIACSELWPIPPKYLVINYKILQIIFFGVKGPINTANLANFSLNLEKLSVDYLRQ